MSYGKPSQGRSDSNQRGILKNGKHTHHSRQGEQKEASFDELNVLATYHPPDKDYGLMKIDEPKTPYHYDPESAQAVDPEVLARKLAKAGPSRRQYSADHSSGMSAEELQHARKFEDHRRQHYNMKEQLRKGKELAARELAELEKK